MPLDGTSAEVKVEDLMRDDTSYTSTDMPRVNPRMKVRVPTHAAHPPAPCCIQDMILIHAGLARHVFVSSYVCFFRSSNNFNGSCLCFLALGPGVQICVRRGCQAALHICQWAWQV